MFSEYQREPARQWHTFLKGNKITCECKGCTSMLAQWHLLQVMQQISVGHNVLQGGERAWIWRNPLLSLLLIIWRGGWRQVCWVPSTSHRCTPVIWCSREVHRRMQSWNESKYSLKCSKKGRRGFDFSTYAANYDVCWLLLSIKKKNNNTVFHKQMANKLALLLALLLYPRDMEK